MGEEAEECNENYLPHFRNIISLPPGYQGISALLILYTWTTCICIQGGVSHRYIIQDDYHPPGVVPMACREMGIDGFSPKTMGANSTRSWVGTAVLAGPSGRRRKRATLSSLISQPLYYYSNALISWILQWFNYFSTIAWSRIRREGFDGSTAAMVYSATKSLLLPTIWLNSIVTYGKSNTTVLNMTYKFFLTWEILKALI